MGSDPTEAFATRVDAELAHSSREISPTSSNSASRFDTVNPFPTFSEVFEHACQAFGRDVSTVSCPVE